MTKTVLAAVAIAITLFSRLSPAADSSGIAFVYLTSPGSSGWTYSHDQGVKRMEEKFGNKLKVTRVENVPESADAERVFRDLAAKGNKVIVGTSFGYQDFALKVARDYPTSFSLAPQATSTLKTSVFTTCVCIRRPTLPALLLRMSRRQTYLVSSARYLSRK